jgi:uncharacterized membrane protein (UPF0127 family)
MVLSMIEGINPRPVVMQQCVNRCTVVALALLVTCVSAACAENATRITIDTDRGAVEVRAEVAATEATRARGLMYRRELAPGRGMLFVFPRTEEHAFWMKNTFISLDMIFIDESLQIVGILRDTVPLSSIPVTIGEPSRYVLEVPGGWAREAGPRGGEDPVSPGCGPGSVR